MVNVKELRLSLGVTQAEFGEAIGVSQALVQSWELGRRQPNGMASKILYLLMRQPGLIKDLGKIGEGVNWQEENNEAIARLNQLGEETGCFSEQYRTF